MFSAEDKTVIRSGLNRLRVAPNTMTQTFYKKLFRVAPEVEELFSIHIDRQSDKLLDMLLVVVQSLDHLQDLVTEIEAMGARHRQYGVMPEHYPVVAKALLDTLSSEIEGWQGKDAKAWETLIDYVADLMVTGARAAA